MALIDRNARDRILPPIGILRATESEQGTQEQGTQHQETLEQRRRGVKYINGPRVDITLYDNVKKGILDT